MSRGYLEHKPQDFTLLLKFSIITNYSSKINLESSGSQNMQHLKHISNKKLQINQLKKSMLFKTHQSFMTLYCSQFICSSELTLWVPRKFSSLVCLISVTAALLLGNSCTFSRINGINSDTTVFLCINSQDIT